MLVVANSAITKMMQKTLKMTETLAHRYLSDSTQQEPYKEYQHDRVKTVLRNFSIFVLRTKVASAMEGLTLMLLVVNSTKTK